jgi:hypothetical protein
VSKLNYGRDGKGPIKARLPMTNLVVLVMEYGLACQRGQLAKDMAIAKKKEKENWAQYYQYEEKREFLLRRIAECEAKMKAEFEIKIQSA